MSDSIIFFGAPGIENIIKSLIKIINQMPRVLTNILIKKHILPIPCVRDGGGVG